MGGGPLLGTTLWADFELLNNPQRRRHHPLAGRTPVGQRESRRGGNSAGVSFERYARSWRCGTST